MSPSHPLVRLRHHVTGAIERGESAPVVAVPVTWCIRHGSEFWNMHADGAIERPGLVRPNASTWRILGAVERNNFGHVVRRYTVADIQAGAVPWLHKNGRQRCHVVDWDHGARREWRNPHTIDGRRYGAPVAGGSVTP